MQEINLLQNKIKDRTLSFERGNRLVIVLFTIGIILELLAAGSLYALSQSNTTKTAELTAENTEIQNALNSSKKDLSTAQGVQAQLININTLLKNRVVWTPFFDNLSALTTKRVQYTTLNGSTLDGKVNVQGVAVDYMEIGKLILSLNSSGKFSNVKLLSITPSTAQTFGYNFSIEAAAAPDNFSKPQ